MTLPLDAQLMFGRYRGCAVSVTPLEYQKWLVGMEFVRSRYPAVYSCARWSVAQALLAEIAGSETPAPEAGSRAEELSLHR